MGVLGYALASWISTPVGDPGVSIGICGGLGVLYTMASRVSVTVGVLGYVLA